MSDLSDLAADVAKDLPASVRRVIDTAIKNGWELNAPGVTLTLRLNHPSDELAVPVYVTWAVGRTPKGNLSFRVDSCGTRGLVPLSGKDLLEYLEDPTIAYPVAEELEAEQEEKARKKAERDAKNGKGAGWDSKATDGQNLRVQLGAEPVAIEDTTARDLMAEQKAKVAAVKTAVAAKSAAPSLRASAPALRVQAPKV